MPITQRGDKWYWGSKGPYNSRKQAEEVQRAAYAAGYGVQQIKKMEMGAPMDGEKRSLTVAELEKKKKQLIKEGDGGGDGFAGTAFTSEGAGIFDPTFGGKGKKKKTQLVKRLAMELPVTLDISDSQFMDVLRANGFDLIEGVGDGIATIRLSDTVPNLRGDPKYTRTFGTVEADIKAANKEYGENLGENLTRVYDPGRKDEPMASSIKETKQAEAAVGLEEKRAER